VGLGVWVDVCVGVGVGLGVWVDVCVGVGVGLGVWVDVCVGVGVGLGVGVWVGVGLVVGVGLGVGDDVGLGVGDVPGGRVGALVGDGAGGLPGRIGEGLGVARDVTVPTGSGRPGTVDDASGIPPRASPASGSSEVRSAGNPVLAADGALHGRLRPPNEPERMAPDSSPASRPASGGGRATRGRGATHMALAVTPSPHNSISVAITLTTVAERSVERETPISAVVSIPSARTATGGGSTTGSVGSSAVRPGRILILLRLSAAATGLSGHTRLCWVTSAARWSPICSRIRSDSTSAAWPTSLPRHMARVPD
ncbi:MAG: hypothetical protein GEU81_14240, partial [Nitriliruptorales bacterium]|nr:hypothetical protein [Nitriliruptorales bacterium]